MGQILTAVQPLNRSHLRAIAKYAVNRRFGSIQFSHKRVPIYFNLTAQRTVSLRLPEEVAEGSVPFTFSYICSVGKSLSTVAFTVKGDLVDKSESQSYNSENSGLIPP